MSWGYEPLSHETEDDSFPLPGFVTDPIGVVRRRWLWMLLTLFAGLAATGAIVLRLQPVYTSETTILISSQTIPEDFVRSTVQEDSLAHVNAIVGTVLSRKNLSDLIEKYDLYPGLRNQMQLASLIDILRASIEITPRDSFRRDSRSQVFGITFDYADAVISARIANELGAIFTAANIEMRNRQAQLTTDFLRRELERSERDLRSQEASVTRFLEANRGSLPGELENSLSRLQRLQAQRELVTTQIYTVEGRLAVARKAAEETSGPTPESLLADLKKSLEENRVVLTEEHPNVIALRRRIERLESEAALAEESGGTPQTTSPNAEGARAIADEQTRLSSLRNQLSDIEGAIATLDAYVEATPMRQGELAQLQQSASILRTTFLEFMRKVQEAELAQSLESAQHGARVSVLDRAHPAPNPRRPVWKIAVLGIIGSLGFALGLAVLLELIDSVVVSPRQLEAIVGKPLLGSVPRVL